MERDLYPGEYIGYFKCQKASLYNIRVVFGAIVAVNNFLVHVLPGPANQVVVLNDSNKSTVSIITETEIQLTITDEVDNPVRSLMYDDVEYQAGQVKTQLKDPRGTIHDVNIHLTDNLTGAFAFRTKLAISGNYELIFYLKNIQQIVTFARVEDDNQARRISSIKSTANVPNSQNLALGEKATVIIKPFDIYGVLVPKTNIALAT
jgi:hypothetical protein